MERGRKRKPRAQKIQEGTYRPDRDYNPLPAPTTKDVPDAPKFLTKRAKEYFKSICGVLADMNILALADIAIITQLAQNLDINEQSYTAMKSGGYSQTTPNGYGAQTADFTVFDKTSKNIRDLCNYLGLSPAARERIKIKPDEKDSDELSMILEG